MVGTLRYKDVTRRRRPVVGVEFSEELIEDLIAQVKLI
jgi:hypothetical protein